MATYPLSAGNRRQNPRHGGGPLAARAAGCQLDEEAGRDLAPSSPLPRSRRARGTLNQEGGDRAAGGIQSGGDPVSLSQAAGGSGHGVAAAGAGSLQQSAPRSASEGLPGSAAPSVAGDSETGPGSLQNPQGKRVLAIAFQTWHAGTQVCDSSFVRDNQVSVKLDKYPKAPQQYRVGTEVIPFSQQLLETPAPMVPNRCCHAHFLPARLVPGEPFLVACMYAGLTRSVFSAFISPCVFSSVFTGLRQVSAAFILCARSPLELHILHFHSGIGDGFQVMRSCFGRQFQLSLLTGRGLPRGPSRSHVPHPAWTLSGTLSSLFHSISYSLQ